MIKKSYIYIVSIFDKSNLLLSFIDMLEVWLECQFSSGEVHFCHGTIDLVLILLTFIHWVILVGGFIDIDDMLLRLRTDAELVATVAASYPTCCRSLPRRPPTPARPSATFPSTILAPPSCPPCATVASILAHHHCSWVSWHKSPARLTSAAARSRTPRP